MKQIIFPVASAVILFSSCQSNEVMESKNIAQSEIHQGYSITYDANDEVLNVNADFRAAGPNGTTLVLSEPADVLCNGKDMKIDTYLFGGAHYTFADRIAKMDEATPFDIEYIDFEKKSYKHHFVLRAVAVDDNISLSKSAFNEIHIQMPTLMKDEVAELEIFSDSTNFIIPIKNSDLRITPKDLADFKVNEEVSIRVSRHELGNLKNATPRGGTYYISYTSKSIKTTIK